jgi:NhaA family Na+:H+ antiporter
VVPVAAAVGGMIVPAIVYFAIAGSTAPKGWAIPTATDIAFALAVLAVISTHLPTALRTFLLTLAVVDDLLAITVIAIFYTDELHPQWLLLALVPLAIFTFLVQRRISSWWLLLPLAFITWALVHASGVHATVAGVLLGFAVPVRARKVKGKEDERPGMAEHFEHMWRPISAGVAVPVFALLSAGVVIGGWSGLQSALTDPIAIGVIAGLVVGKPIGILISTFLTSKITRRPLQKGLTWPDLTGVALLGGIGFTVSLLIGELAFGGNSAADDHVKIAVLAGSVAAAVLAAILLRARNRRYRAMWDEETIDQDHDGIPDIYEQGT